MNHPEDKLRKLSIAVPSNVDANPFIRAMLDSGLLPVNCRRFVIDSGDPSGVMTIYADCFVDDRILDERIIKSISELAALPRVEE